MAYKDKLKEQQYQKEYYEKHKKLKGRRKKRAIDVSSRATFKSSSKKSRKKAAIHKKLQTISDKWHRMTKADKKSNKAKYLKKLKDIKNRLYKNGGKSKKSRVATDISGKTYSSKGFGNVGGRAQTSEAVLYDSSQYQEGFEALFKNVNNKKVSDINEESVSKLLKSLLKKTKTKSKSKGKKKTGSKSKTKKK